MSDTQARTRKLGIAFKLSLLILTSTTLIFLAAFGYNYLESRSLVLKYVEENAGNLTLATAQRIENILKGVKAAPSYLASSLEFMHGSRPELLKQIENMVKLDPDIFGSTAAFEPYAYDSRSFYFAPYYYEEKDQMKFSWLGGKDYRYHRLDWYLLPRKLERPVWSEPYFDKGGGNIEMSTFSVPFYRSVKGRRTFAGVVTADMSLKRLKDIVSKVTIYRTGYAFLISKKGVFVTHPNKDWILHGSIFSVADAAGDPELRKIGKDMVQGGKGFVPLPVHFTGKKAWMYYAPLPSAGWSIGVVIPEDELFADIRNLGWIVLAIGIAGFAFLFLVVIFISNTITGPLRKLAGTAAEIAKGSLDAALPEKKSADEVGDLTDSFENMRRALKEYIANLKETTAAKERMESELKIAHTIQMSFLPKRFPPFPEKEEFDIYAMLVPAREVGGDLYDFFLLDDDTLFFSVGDVSGKGVPAALFMAASKIAMKGFVNLNVDLSETLGKVNRELCVDNETTMFVTVFCGTLNFKTGELRYSNAGHNPPLLLRQGKDPEWLPLPEGLFLGVFEDSAYKTLSTRMNPGDTLLLYTDGVTEAMNREGQAYSDERLFGLAGKNAGASPENLVRDVVRSVQEYAGEEPQSDDITLLVLQYKGSSKI
jgi:sigma-B regulation protein RsbU (phosphoserine phosphatase)